MGRTRFAKNRNLEKYVRVNKAGYVTYKHPLMDEYESFGKDIEAANSTARLVNAELSGQSSRVDNIRAKLASPKSDNRTTFDQVLDRFKKDRVPELEWSANYKEAQFKRIEKFAKYGDVLYENTSIGFFSEMVDGEFSGDSRRIAISLINLIDTFAVGKGLRHGSNVAKGVLVPSKKKRQRQRIDNYGDFKTIRANGEQWERDVLDFALITLQPREVICSLDVHKHIKKENGRTFLRFQRGKTGVYIEIEVGETLAPLIARRRKEAVRLGTHRLFCRAVSRKTASVNIQPEYLTRRITSLIIESGLYEKDHPTLHEVRSLGGRMMEDQGYEKKLIQDLYGHKKSATTEIYLNPDKPKYTKAKSVLEIE
jgi:hypothetical protein